MTIGWLGIIFLSTLLPIYFMSPFPDLSFS